MRRTVLAVILCLAASGAVAEQVDTRQLIFKTKNGNVSFMHGDHQDTEKNCSTCHANGTGGKIPGFSKDVAHKLCIDCHKQKNGPTGCAQCHEK